ncbi:MAG: N-acetylglucosamine-6-phosphate deacetylase [Firmicutes bacterium]|nr:N-acetylglucosamine-6-phosphate deacetylase [Bacillota bacterium]
MENEVLQDKVIVFNDKIIDILDIRVYEESDIAKKIYKVIDARGKYVSPGFIDVHIHGAGGKDTMDGGISDLRTISEALAENGVTAFLPTTMTMEREKIYKALDAVRSARSESFSGAKILGVHLEGPFISRKRKGAHDENHIVKPDFQFIENYIDIIKIITIAPEEDPGFRFIKEAASRGIVLSMGHTNSDYETAMEAVRNGISSATHMFNAMPALHHRAPGAAGAVLYSDLSFELIADTLHVHPALFQILLNAKGRGKMILITDAMRACGMRNGCWDLGGREVTVDNDSARIADGTLAGSILTLNRAVFNMLKHTDLEIHEAVALASINPARLINMDGTKGSIEKGKDADLIIFDERLEVDLSISEGRIIFEK